jgi:hypothetical protein
LCTMSVSAAAVPPAARQSVERLGHDINRDYWMSAAEAKEYGVVDLIVGQTAATVAADRAEAAVKDTPGASTRSANGTR